MPGHNKPNKKGLILWQPGKSGNPKGRPKKIPELNVLLANVLGEEKDGISAAEVILRALRYKAARGDVRAAEVLLDRGYGKTIQSLHVTTKDEPLIAKIEIIKIMKNDNAAGTIEPGTNAEGIDQP